MKSTKIVVSLLGVVVLALSGCGTTSSSSQGGTSTSAAPTNADLKCTLTIAGPQSQAWYIQNCVQDFLTANKYDNVKFKMMALGEDKADTDTTDWTTGPDVYAFASDKLMNLKKAGALSTVPSTYATKMTTDMGETSVSAGKIGDTQLGYPYAGDNGYFLYYNTDLVPANQTDTFEHIVAACASKGVKFAYPFNTAFYSMGELMTWGANYTVTLKSDASGIASIKGTFNTDKGLKAAKAMKQMMDNPNVSYKSGCQAAPTSANKIGAVVDGSWSAASYTSALDVKDADGKVTGNKLGACKLPTITVDGETKNIASYLGYKEYGVNPLVSGTDTARLALDHALANYLVSESVQSGRFDAFQTAPTNKTVAALDKVKNNICVNAINEQAKYAIPQTVVPAGVWKAPDSLYAGLDDKSISTDAQITTALVALNTKVEDINAK